jgi:hypothetical protein
MLFKQQKREDVDIILKILETLLQARPDTPFVKSLHFQYLERGSLSRKQLEGLLGKATQSKIIAANWLATLEAIIKKMPVREKAAPTIDKPMFEKDEATGKMIEEILQKFPQHRQALLLKNKYDLNEIITPKELKELQQFHAVAKKKG